MTEITIKEIEVQKLRLEPGDVLVVRLKRGAHSHVDLSALSQVLRCVLPEVKWVFGSDDIDLTVVTPPSEKGFV